MSSQECSYYSHFRKCLLSWLSNRRMTYYVFFWGVLLSLGLALVPNSSYALDYSINNLSASFSSDYGCNTVNSDSGVVAVGARGWIFGATNNDSGCGYYRDSSGLHWLPDGYSGGCSFSDNGSVITCNDPYDNRFTPSLQYDDYISKNFRSAVKKFETGSFSTTNSNFSSISANSDASYLSLLFFQVPLNTITSHLTPSIIFNTGNPPYLYHSNHSSFTEQEKEQFMTDLYNNTIFEYGSPKDYVDFDLYSELMSAFGFTSDEDWDTNDWAFIASYLPTYNFDYEISHISYSVSTPIVQNSINLEGFSAWEIGLGNNASSATYPKLDYFILSPTYNKNSLNSKTELVGSMRSFTYSCLSNTCIENNQKLLQNYKIKHTNDTNGWTFTSNPAGSWFNVFGAMNVLNPFNIIFNSFSNSQCVNIPIIAGMLNVSNTQYCSWWGGNIRQILTPVFVLSSSILLFGFVIHWLRGGDHPLFTNKQIKGDK